MDKVTGQCPQTTTFQKRKESRGGIEPRPVRRLPRLTVTELNALPLGQTSSHHQSAHMAPVRKRSPPCEYANGIGTVSVRVKLFAVGPGPVLTAGAKWPTSRQKYKKEKRRKNVWWKRRRKTNKRSEKKEEAGNVSHWASNVTKAGDTFTTAGEGMPISPNFVCSVVSISNFKSREIPDTISVYQWVHESIIVIVFFLRIAPQRSMTFGTAPTEPSSGLRQVYGVFCCCCCFPLFPSPPPSSFSAAYEARKVTAVSRNRDYVE